jgi:5'-methylthioadenosine/S-adenosylhomocysteine nucleosidase
MTNKNSSEKNDLNVGSVDVAIVTALKIERDAVLARLEDVKVVQIDLEPYTYYRGRVAIPASSEHYEVVLVMLLDMGNVEAAAATTILIERWKPSSVMMVGIAGGVEGKVALGDVVVATYVHYYEPGKIKPRREERRFQQFYPDRLLYGRAIAYEESEWKGEIKVTRPGAESETVHLPDAHFGAIGSGENVIADEKALARLMAECPKMIAVAMEGAGVARAATNAANTPRFLEIRGICDYANSTKNDSWHAFAAGAAASFTIGFLRSCPLPPLSRTYSTTNEVKPPLVILTAQSLRPISVDELLPSFGADLKGRDVEAVSLDFTDLMKGGGLAEPAEAARRLVNPRGKLLGALARRAESELVFHGLVHNPLAVLAGHLVSDRQPVGLFDFHPSPGSNTWDWPDGDTSFPSINVEDLPTSEKENGDAIIRFSVSYQVTATAVEAIVPAPLFDVDLRIPSPERSIVRSEAQTRAYGHVFRQVIDRLAQGTKVPHLIHLFYSGPVSLAFHLGQQISENIHPPVIVWNFRQGVYEWGINLSTAISGEKCVVYPSDFAARP